MSKPITSRVKRSPLFKYNAPLKQTNPLGKSVKVGGSEEGKDEIIETEVKTPKKTLQRLTKIEVLNIRIYLLKNILKKLKQIPYMEQAAEQKKFLKQ